MQIGPSASRAEASLRSAAGHGAAVSGTQPTSGGDLESLAWLGWFRFMAIAGVVLIHVNGLTAVARYGDSSAVGQLALVLDFASRWSVPAFVMASGAMLLDPSRFRGAGDFLRRRAARLVPPLVVWHLVYAAVLVWATALFEPADLVHDALVGKLYTALYFFWIVLGLALFTPMLVPWVATASTRAVGIAGVVLAAMPAATMAIVPVAPASEGWVRTAVTWWVPYLGYFLLGYALRRAPIRNGAGVLALAGFALGSAWVVWQWKRGEGLGAVLEHYLPAESYFHPGVAVSACSALYLARWIVRPGALGALFASHRGAALGRALGGATLGVYGVHQLVLLVVERMPALGPGATAADPVQLITRCVLVLAGSYLFAVVAGRVPGLRLIV